MDVHQRDTHGQTPAARVGAVIHEYAGYARKEQRRQDDKRVRAYIALRLSSAVKELLRFRASQTERMNGAADEFDLSMRRLRNAIDAVTDIPSGYSSFFDVQRLRPNEADRLIAADAGLIEQVQGLVAFVAQLTRLSADDALFRDGCSTLCRRVTDLARTLEARADLFAA